jgi:hypothetical protein
MFRKQRGRRVLGLAKGISAGAAVVAAMAVAPRASASDVHDLQRNLPLEVEDTTPAEEGSLQFQTSARYEHTNDDQDRLTIEPQFQYGLLPHVHVELSYPVIAGDADRTGSGDVTAAVLYNFLQEENSRPAMAVKAQVELPTGVGSDGLDTDLRFLLTKTLNENESQDRVHLNVGWIHNAAAASDERHNRFIGIVGYSRKLSDQTVFLADLVREQQEQEGLDSTILEAGFLHQLNDKVTLAAGIGAGLGEDSPDVRITIGVQYSF